MRRHIASAQVVTSLAAVILASLLVGNLAVQAVNIPQSAVRNPQSITAFHRSGQTFITWTERADLSGERYHVYRHTSPITAANLAQATRLTEAWGALGEGSSTFWSELSRDPPLTPNYVIQDLGTPLSDTTGLFVWTTHEDGSFYYAVTTVEDGTENITDFDAGNTTGPIAETVADPQPVKVWEATRGRGFVFTQYLDYSRYNPTFGVPQGSAAQQYAFNYGVTLPSDAACGGSLPDSLPGNVYLEGWGGRYSNDSMTPYDWCVVMIVPDDPNQTWYYGHSASYDYRLGGTANSGPIVNFTEERILRAVYDAQRDPTFRLDANRIYVYGHSMGGSGALALGMRYPNVFAATYSSEPMTNYRTSDMWLSDTEPKWGTVANNLPIENRGPSDWADHLSSYDGTDVWDWQNHQQQLVSRRGDDMAHISLAHGTLDDVIAWSSQGQPAYEPFYQGRRTFSGATVAADHTWIGFSGLGPNVEDYNYTGPFYAWTAVRDESLPGLTYASGSSAAPPSGAGATYNLNLEWSASWLDWDGAPIDTADQWRISLRTTDGSTQTVDVTPRRLQTFSIVPADAYAWENRRVSDNGLVASGTVFADADGLVTVPAFQVTASGNRLILRPGAGGPTATPTSTPTPTTTGQATTATPTPTPTTTATPTPTPTQSPIPNIQYLFQNGVSPDPSYAGTTDSIITTWGGNSFANLGGWEYLQVGETGDADEFRLLVRFELDGWLPADVQIEEAWLELRAYDSGYDNGPHDVVAHRVIEQWVEGNGWDLSADGRSEGVTWTTARPGVDWATPGGDFDLTELDRVTVAANPDGWYQWDVTAAVRAWIDGTASNYGLLLEPDNAPWLHHQFRSSEYGFPTLRPRLVVNVVEECIPGDMDCDCDVDILDVMLVAARWRTAVGDEDYDPAYDLDSNGEIDIVDIMLVAIHWGESCTTTPTPTPTATATATATPTATPTPDGTPPTDFCPAYVDSPLYRTRQTQTTAGPADDWMGAISGAQPGTEILLLDGEYLLDEYAVLVYDDVTIRSASGNRDGVLIRGMGYGVGSEGFMVFGANVTIADLSMTAMRNHAISIKGEQGPQSPHIYNVHLYDIGTQHVKGTPGGIADGVVACSSIGYTPGGVQGDYIDGVDIHQAIDWVIRDNLFYNIWGDGTGCEVDIDCGTYISGPAILMWNNASGTIVERNIFRDCFRNVAFGLGNGHQGGIIRNNFIYQSTPGDAGIELRDANNAQVQHNTIILGGDYPGAIEVWNASGHLIQNNLITAPIWNRGNASFTAEGNITDASNDDLATPGDPHLPPGSRAIGAGVSCDVDSDIDGDPRVGRWDVGCDQFSQ